jgi:hypothetical protein
MPSLRTFLLAASLLVPCAASSSEAHSGRTDAKGGHYNRKTGEYHYHGAGPSVDDLPGLARTKAPTTSRSEARTESPQPRSTNARTHLTPQLGSLSSIRNVEEPEDPPAVAQIVKEPNAKLQSTSRAILDYARREYALGNIEVAMKYVRRVITNYAATDAAGDAKQVLEEWKDSEPFREWTVSTGKFKTSARFARLEKGSVYLVDKSERTIAVDLKRLSKADQQYVMHREGI